MINVYGGSRDTWANPNAMPAVNVDFKPELAAASAFYTTQPQVVTISCSGEHGHFWPSAATTWLASTLLSFPKGTAAN